MYPLQVIFKLSLQKRTDFSPGIPDAGSDADDGKLVFMWPPFMFMACEILLSGE
jgi:hypothetical protein